MVNESNLSFQEVKRCKNNLNVAWGKAGVTYLDIILPMTEKINGVHLG
jgi:hypothetical protein